MQFNATPQKEKASVSARREREIRHQRKRGDVAACKIVRWWRGVVCRLRDAERLQGEYDAAFARHFPDESSVNTLRLKPLKVPVPDGMAIFALLVHFLRIPEVSRSRGTFITLIRIVDISLNRRAANQSFASVYFKEPYKWLVVAGRLIATAVSTMGTSIHENNKLVFGGMLKFLLDLTSTQCWGFLKQEPIAERSAMLQKVTVEALPELLRCIGAASPASLAHVAQIYFASPLYSSSGSVDDVITASLMALCSKVASSSANAAAAFSHEVLGKVVGFQSLLAPETRVLLAKNKKFWEQAFLAPHEVDTGETSRWPTAALTCNILEMGVSAVQHSPCLGPAWCQCFAHLMTHIPARSDMVKIIEADDVIGRQLQQLWEPSTVALLFPGLLGDKVLTRSHTSFLFGQMRMRNAVGYAETCLTSVLVVLCLSCPSSWDAQYKTPTWLPSAKLFNGLVYSWDTRAAINTLTSHPFLLTSLWNHISSYIKKYEQYVHGECNDEGLGEVLLLFLHCYDNVLQVTDDREFYDMQRPFALSAVTYMVPLFTKLAFRLMWDGIDERTTPTAFAKQKGGLKTRLLLVSRSLLQKLHQRNTRRTFCSEVGWSVPEFKLSRGFNFTDVLKYLKENTHNNPFENLFGVLRELSSEMLQSSDPLERHFGDIFGNLRNLFSGLHEMYNRPREQEATTVLSNEDLLRYQCLIRPMPFVIAYKERLEYLRCLIERDREANHASDVKFPVTVRRTHVLEDSVKELARLDASGAVHLKAQLHVKFLNQEGLPEDGIDEGGLFKELLEVVIQKAFSPGLGYFIETGDRALYPNPNSKQCASYHGTHIDFFKFMGRVLAKAVYEGVVVDVVFADFFLNTILSQPSNLGDLASYDKEIYKHLLSLKDMQNIEDLDLNFTLYDASSEVHVALVPNGERVMVTDANLSSYLKAVTNYRLNVQMQEQAMAFVAGFHEILPQSMLALFDRKELQQLISGLDGAFDIMELRQFTRYEGYTPDAAVVSHFWDTLSEFTDEQKSAFLRFVTSAARPPLLGFGHITPPFMIRAVPADTPSRHIDRLPSASTCFNLLCLPPYPTKDNLKEKLLYAITSGTGFELS